MDIEPTLVVGLEEFLPLDRVRGAVFFGDGIAIANLGSYEVLLVDSAGRLVSRQGGKGDGPGEYRHLSGVFRHNDGLITWDAFHSRVTLLDSRGEHLSDKTVRPRAGTNLVGAFGNSVLLEFSERGFPGEEATDPREIRPEVQFSIVRLSDGAVTFERTRPGAEQWAAREGERGGGRTHGGLPVIFGRHAVSATTARRAYLATTDSLTLTGYDEMGVRADISFEQTRVSANKEWEQYVRDSTRARIEAMGSGEMTLDDGRNFLEVLAEFRLGLLEDLPARATLPSFSAIKGGADGHLWIREYPSPMQDHVVWIGFNETWRKELRVEVPLNLRVLDLSEDKVLVLGKGALDEDVVEVYQIRR